MDLHIDYCKGFGVTLEQMESAEEHVGTLEQIFVGSRTTQRPCP